MLANVGFGIATLFGLIVLAIRYARDRNGLILVLGSVALLGSVVSFVAKTYDSSNKYEALTAKNESMAHDIRFAKAIAVMNMGGGL